MIKLTAEKIRGGCKVEVDCEGYMNEVLEETLGAFKALATNVQEAGDEFYHELLRRLGDEDDWLMGAMEEEFVNRTSHFEEGGDDLSVLEY